MILNYLNYLRTTFWRMFLLQTSRRLLIDTRRCRITSLSKMWNENLWPNKRESQKVRTSVTQTKKLLTETIEKIKSRLCRSPTFFGGPDWFLSSLYEESTPERLRPKVGRQSLERLHRRPAQK